MGKRRKRHKIYENKERKKEKKYGKIDHDNHVQHQPFILLLHTDNITHMPIEAIQWGELAN